MVCVVVQTIGMEYYSTAPPPFRMKLSYIQTKHSEHKG